MTHEEPLNGSIQFLDVNLQLRDEHICWAYQPHSKQQILNYSSAHSDVVKRSIAMNCLRGSLDKSCPHRVAESMDAQVACLTCSGFP